MELLKRLIKTEGVTSGTDLIKVDRFLNHRVNPFLMKEIASEFRKRFQNEPITKIVTAEASGIAIAAFTALEFGVDFVFAKKYNSENLKDDVYKKEIFSENKNQNYSVIISKKTY